MLKESAEYIIEYFIKGYCYYYSLSHIDEIHSSIQTNLRIY